MTRPKRLNNLTITSTLTPPPTLSSSQSIARIVKAAGNNLYTAALPSGEQILVELESKFRSTIWMKRGTYVLVDRKGLAERENRLAGEIVGVVGDERVWMGRDWWPKEFQRKTSKYEEDSEEEESTVGKMPPGSEDEEE